MASNQQGWLHTLFQIIWIKVVGVQFLDNSGQESEWKVPSLMPIRVKIKHPCKNPLMAIDLLSIIYWHNSHNYFNFLGNMLHDLTFKPMSLAQGSFFYKNGAPKALKFLLFEFFMFIVISNNLYNLSNFWSDLIHLPQSLPS